MVASLPASRKASEDNPANIRLPVAIGVFGVQDVGRRANKDSAVIATDGGGPVQVVEEDGTLFEDPVTVGIFQ